VLWKGANRFSTSNFSLLEIVLLIGKFLLPKIQIFGLDVCLEKNLKGKTKIILSIDTSSDGKLQLLASNFFNPRR